MDILQCYRLRVGIHTCNLTYLALVSAFHNTHSITLGEVDILPSQVLRNLRRPSVVCSHSAEWPPIYPGIASGSQWSSRPVLLTPLSFIAYVTKLGSIVRKLVPQHFTHFFPFGSLLGQNHLPLSLVLGHGCFSNDILHFWRCSLGGTARSIMVRPATIPFRAGISPFFRSHDEGGRGLLIYRPSTLDVSNILLLFKHSSMKSVPNLAWN